MHTVPTTRPRLLEAKVPALAVQLARVAHFRSLDLPDADELDRLAFALIGDVGGHVEQACLWEQLQEPAIHLWHLIVDDWDDRDLDELTDADADRLTFSTGQAETDHRYTTTRQRLEHDIEHAVMLARICAAEVARGRRAVPAYPAGYRPVPVAS